MAVTNRNTLVLDSVSVVRGVLTGTMGMAFASASGKILAIPFSMRPPSHAFPQAGQKTSTRQDHADTKGAVAAANRAGRSECSGSLTSTSPVWSLAMGGSCLTAAWRLGRYPAEHPASVGNVLPRRHVASGPEALARRTGETLSTSARGFGF
jgi:hypothetical protein